MGMQYDVKSAFATADAALVAYRVRIKGVFYAVTTAGADVIFMTTHLRPQERRH
jgi:SHS2 domain-containing protein